MPLPLIPLLTGAASAVGAYFQNKSAKAAAQKQMDFQERMSSTSYQRATQDMQIAGINPMLAYQQGGASSPGGAMPQVSDVVGPAVSSAVHARRLQEELKGLQADRRVKEQEAARLYIENQGTSGLHQEEIKARTRAADAQSRYYDQSSLHSAAQTKALGYEFPGMANKAMVEGSMFGKGSAWVDRVRDTIFPFLMLGAARGALRKFGGQTMGSAESQWLGGNR